MVMTWITDFEMGFTEKVGVLAIFMPLTNENQSFAVT